MKFETDDRIRERLAETPTFKKWNELVNNGENLNEASFDVIQEAYGKVGPNDFNSMSEMITWFTHRQNIFRKMVGHD